MKRSHLKQKTAEAADISYRYLDFLIAGDREASARVARRLGAVVGGNETVWSFGTEQERRTCWEKYEEKNL